MREFAAGTLGGKFAEATEAPVSGAAPRGTNSRSPEDPGCDAEWKNFFGDIDWRPGGIVADDYERFGSDAYRRSNRDSSHLVVGSHQPYSFSSLGL